MVLRLLYLLLGAENVIHTGFYPSFHLESILFMPLS